MNKTIYAGIAALAITYSCSQKQHPIKITDAKVVQLEESFTISLGRVISKAVPRKPDITDIFADDYTIQVLNQYGDTIEFTNKILHDVVDLDSLVDVAKIWNLRKTFGIDGTLNSVDTLDYKVKMKPHIRREEDKYNLKYNPNFIKKYNLPVDTVKMRRRYRQ